jgi:hypothetical protein
MNTRLSSCAFGVAAFLSTAASYAADTHSQINRPGVVASNEAASTMTPEQHRASIIAAMRSGEIQRGEANWPNPAPAERSSLNRAEVKQAARQAELAGLLSRGEAQLAAAPSEASTLSRAEVKAETRVAMHLHQIPRGEAAMFSSSVIQSVELGAAPVEQRSKVASRDQASKSGLSN